MFDPFHKQVEAGEATDLFRQPSPAPNTPNFHRPDPTLLTSTISPEMIEADNLVVGEPPSLEQTFTTISTPS